MLCEIKNKLLKIDYFTTKKEAKILVFASHPDDETIGA